MKHFVNAIYLGDAVYVQPHEVPGGVVICTTDGRDVTNLIVLEPEVYDALAAYVTRLRAEQAG